MINIIVTFYNTLYCLVNLCDMPNKKAGEVCENKLTINVEIITVKLKPSTFF